MKRLLKYISPYKWPMLLGLFLKFIAAMLDLMIPYLLERIIDQAAPTGKVWPIVLCGGIMVACAVAAIVTNVAANRMATYNSGRVTRTLRHDLFAKVSYLSAKQTDQFTVSSLISRITTDSYNFNNMLVRVQRLGVRSPFLLIGGICITMTLDPVLTLVLISMLPIIAVVVYLVTKYSVPIYTHCQRILDRLVRVVQENATGVRVIKALSKSEHERKRFDSVNEELADEDRKAGAIMAVTNPVATVVLNLGLTLVVIAGAHRVNSGLTEPGTIIAFLSYFTIILNAMLGITRIFVVCSKGVASANRIAEVLSAEDDMPIFAEDSEITSTPCHIEMEHVSFSYNKVQNNLTDIDFRLERGQTLGIIGATGSGKSTIVNLLIRFYDPDEGIIRIDGRDIRSIERSELCKKYGIAFQNDFIMASSIRGNISFGRDLTDEEINRAIVLAQAKGMLDELSEGLDYGLTARGTNVSGGQKQRMIIARALAARPEILVLDDSSSALDYKTDAELRRALHDNLPNTTTIIIAQRISSIMNADLILMLDEGEIIGRGTHEQLMKTCSEYRMIADTQMGGVR
ncbi:MAG: ABC transporter ATP-binding protein [Christensenellaceae bacterium]|nr:ABC transporter ATP-binding protein [Christensenellaceae bacterium]